jgi:hypothetical protein
MKKVAILALALTLLGGLSLAAAAQVAPSPYEKYLKVADVEGVTGLTGLKLVPRDPTKGAGGDLNFAQADGTLVLIANFMTLKAKDYPAYKAQLKSYSKGDVPGLGDDAFNGPPNDPQYFLTFRKGEWVVSLSSFFSPKDGKIFVPMAKQVELAKIIIGRL